MDTIDKEKPTAAILRFPRRRGRPRITKPGRDTGTPELVMKRLKQETIEALDLCLERGIITPEQHWCGIHLRWLYTLKHGAPGVRAIDTTHLGGSETKTDDPEWRSSREKEYNEVIEKLSLRKLALPVMNLCIHNERPKFLNLRSVASIKNIKKYDDEIAQIQSGLDILVKHWERGHR